MIDVRLGPRFNVDLVVRCEHDLSTRDAWACVSNFEEIACLDFFHAGVELEPPRAQAGASLRIRHHWCGVEFVRVGRILYWNEGRGYAFSDLSRRTPQLGFPHVYHIGLNSDGGSRSTVTVRVRGRWTARALPRLLIRAWLGWIGLKIWVTMRNTLLRHALNRGSHEIIPGIDPGANH